MAVSRIVFASAGTVKFVQLASLRQIDRIKRDDLLGSVEF